MKRLFKKNPGKLAKGMPSAVALSILIHAALFLLAGMLVVFTVVKKEEKKFTPPKAVERPKMKLRKPKVKIKKTSKPKPTTRIVTKMNRASMPEIQLPEMSGMGEGLGGGLGGFDIMPDFDEVSAFGSGQSIGNDFVGTFYDFLKDRSGRNIPMDHIMLLEVLRDYIEDGWKPSDLARYYRSPKKLYATTCMFPLMESIMARIAFDEFEEGHQRNDYCWVIHYKGQLVHKDGIKFRFWGAGDSLMVVRVNGEIVLDVWGRGGLVPSWQTSSADSYKYWLGTVQSVVGDWIELEPGVPLDMEYLFSDLGGGAFGATLLVEVEGVEYPRNRQNGPILPIFKTAELSRDLEDAILEYLIPGEACITNGPVFCDYGVVDRTDLNNTEEVACPPVKPVLDRSIDSRMKTWTTEAGESIEAGLVTVIGDKAVLKDSRGKQRKILLARLSPEDREFIELAQPPKFNIDFSKQSSQRAVPPSGIIIFNAAWEQPKLYDYVFSAKLKQTSAGEYNHELRVEFFAIGTERHGNNYILLDRQETTFTSTRENQRSLEFSGKPVLLVDSNFYRGSGYTERRGEKYSSYLVTVTDERGKIIDYATPNIWLFENLENLKKLPVGKRMDKTCTRTYPTPPKSFRY